MGRDVTTFDTAFPCRAAPYDFRFAPHSQEAYFQRLKAMVEEMYER